MESRSWSAVMVSAYPQLENATTAIPVRPKLFLPISMISPVPYPFPYPFPIRSITSDIRHPTSDISPQSVFRPAYMDLDPHFFHHRRLCPQPAVGRLGRRRVQHLDVVGGMAGHHLVPGDAVQNGITRDQMMA